MGSMKSRKGTSAIQNLEELRKILLTAKFPASKKDLMIRARLYGTNMNVVTILQLIPDKTYESAQDVFGSFGIYIKEGSDYDTVQ